MVAFLTAALVLALTVLGAGLLLVAAYLTTLTTASLVAWWEHRRLRGEDSSRLSGGSERWGKRRFAVLIPAHNEELLIGRLLKNLDALDFPRASWDAYVVADNCDDGTPRISRGCGARVFERFDDAARSKGHALRWLLDRIRETSEQYDAFVVLDADSVVASNFLRVMERHLDAGSLVIQAYYSVLNVGASPVAALRFAALAAVHYVRPLGRSRLGMSSGLKGNGMCFAAPVLERFSWSWFALAEDVEFHLALVAAGIRVDFAPEATVLADMPVTLRQAASQNDRWERGRLELLRKAAPQLIGDGLRRIVSLRAGGAMRIDAAVEQLLPPLSVPFAVGASCLVGALVVGAPLAAAMATVSLIGQSTHLLVAMAMVGAPRRAYLALAYAPVYILWKVWLYARACTGSSRVQWVRTERAVNSV